MREQLYDLAKWWMELARNLIVASVLLALARRSQDWLVTLFAYATILIFVGHYLTYVLDAILKFDRHPPGDLTSVSGCSAQRSWRLW